MKAEVDTTEDSPANEDVPVSAEGTRKAGHSIYEMLAASK